MCGKNSTGWQDCNRLMAADANGRRRDFFAGVQKQRLELQPLVYISFGGGGGGGGACG